MYYIKTLIFKILFVLTVANLFAHPHLKDELKAHPHIHTDEGRKETKHNSLLYLNNNFLGGEFVTKSGILIRPKKGMLTLFDGQKVYHGVKRVKQNDRKTIIFWWRN